MPKRGMRIRKPVCTKRELSVAPFLYGLDLTIRKEAAYADTGRTVMVETNRLGTCREQAGKGRIWVFHEIVGKQISGSACTSGKAKGDV